MTKKIILIALALFFCFAILLVSGIFAYVYISQAPSRALQTNLSAQESIKTVTADFTISYKFSMPYYGSSYSISGNATGDAQVDIEKKLMALNLSASVPLSIYDDKTELQMVIDDSDIYIKGLSGNNWTKQTFNSSEIFGNFNLTSMEEDDISNYEYIGDGTVNAQKVYIYRINVDTAELNTILERYLAEEYGNGSLSGTTVTYDSVVGYYKIYQDSNQTAQIELTMSMTINTGTKTKSTYKIDEIKVVLTFDNYNLPVDIEIPTVTVKTGRPSSAFDDLDLLNF